VICDAVRSTIGRSVLILLGLLPSLVAMHAREAGWGVDACLSTHVGRAEGSQFLSLLEQSGVGWVREREVGSVSGTSAIPGPWLVDQRPFYREIKRRGFRIAAFATLPFQGVRPQPGNHLLEDLNEVYAQGRFLGRELHGLVDAWEMVCEPDVGYCTDLPDRLAAYQKALYLGIKQGSREAVSTQSDGGDRGSVELQESRASAEAAQASGLRNVAKIPASERPSPFVAMGALALPPGPWLERAIRNDLLSYTDAYNFHFYGHAADLTGVIAAHERVTREFEATRINQVQGIASREFPSNPPGSPMDARGGGLPLWITECGVNATRPSDFLNPERRALQAEFAVSTARQALVSPSVSLFMPFILVNKGDPHAMALSAAEPLPAWNAFADYTRVHPWPKRPLVRPPESPNPVVVQWLPDNSTTVPHKVSGTYRFLGDRPIRGVLRIYNFSAESTTGHLIPKPAVEVREQGLTSLPIVIPAQGEVSIPLEFHRTQTNGYFRADWAADFVEVSGRRSKVAFGLETTPEARDFTVAPLPLAPNSTGSIKHPIQPRHESGERASEWMTVNGLRLETMMGESNATDLRMWTTGETNDPLRPTMAVAALKGLPREGFLRATLDRPMSKNAKLRVDLVDSAGQRFTVWENFGMSYFRPSNEVWLNLKDFGIYFWGRCTGNPVFRPELVEEIQLRVYLAEPEVPMTLALSVMSPKRN
jgi:hypothetical protein